MLIRSLAIALFALVCAAVPASAGVRIALLPIAVHAAGDDSAYLESGLSEMIAARLDQYEGVTVVRPTVEGAAPSSPETARAAGERSGADYVVYGSFTRFGDGASLDLRCVPTAPGSPEDADARRRLFIQSGKLAEIIPKLDTVAQKIARYTTSNSSTPQRLGANDGKAPAAPDAPTAAQYQALLERVEELERALIPPVAESAPEDDVLVR